MKKILFIHGWGQTKEVWKGIEKYLKDEYKCYFITLKGFDDPSKLDYAYTPYDYAKELYEKYKDIDFIVAHSYGAKVALEYILNFLEVPLLLIGPAIIKPKKSFSIKLKILKYKILKRLNKINNDLESIDYKNSIGKMRTVFRYAINTYYNEEIKILDSKITLLYGNDDLTTPLKEGKRIVKLNKKIKLLKMDGGHSCFINNPIRFVMILNKWVSKYGDN